MIKGIVRRVRMVLMASFAMLAAHGQAVVSVADGPWNDPNTWSPVMVPDAANSVSITVNHVVTLPSGYSVAIDGTTVNNSLILGGSLTVGATAGSLVVNGTITAQNTSSFLGTNGSNVSFNSGSVYNHAFTTLQGVVPLAQWDSNSTLLISGFTNSRTLNASGNWNQNFGKVTYNCAAQIGTINFSGLLNSVAGDLTFLNSNGVQVYLGSSQNFTLTIGGSLVVSGPTTRVVFSTTGSPTFNIGLDFSFASTSAGGTITSTNGQSTFNVNRDFIVNAPGGIIRLGYISSTGGATFNVGRHMTVVSGTLFESSDDPGTSYFRFTNGSSHIFSNSGSIDNNIHYVVGASDILTVSGESALIGDISSALDVSGTLVLSSTNVSGAIQTGYGNSPAGNVWVQTRTFNSGAILSYAGAAAQAIGNGQPSTIGVTTLINNSSGVSLNSTSSLVTMGDLNVQLGNLDISKNSLSVQNLTTTGGTISFTTTTSTRSLTVNGSLQLTNGSITVSSGAATADFIIKGDIGVCNGNVSFAGAFSRITTGGSGAFSNPFPLPGATTVKTINITRGGGGALAFVKDLTVTDININSGGLDMNAGKSLTILNNLNIAAGGTLFFEGSSVNLQKLFNNTLTGGVLSSDASSTLSFTGSAAVGTVAFSPSGNTLGTLLLNRTGGGTILTLNSTLNIATTFDLRDGIFQNTSGLSMNSGSVIILTPNATYAGTGVAPAGGPYDVTYNDGVGPVVTSMTSSKEAQGSVRDINMNLSGTLTAGTTMTVNRNLNLNTGIFSNSSSRLTMAAASAIVRNSTASMSGSIPGGGPYNLTYNGTSLTSGVDARGSLINFTSNVSGTATINVLMTVPGNATINSGTLSIGANTLTMGNGATFIRNSGTTISGSIPAGGPYHVNYTGTSLTTQVEAQGNLNNVSSNLSGTATQGNALTAAGTLTVNSGTWNSGANAVSVNAVVNGATLTAPSTTLTLTGNFTDNGTFNHNNGTVVFNGNSTIGGAGTVFNNIQLNTTKTLTAPASMQVAGNITFASGSTFNHSSGTVLLSAGAAQSLDVQGTQFYNVTVNKSGGSVTLTSALNLAQVLAVNSATAFASNGFLTVLSQPGGPGDDTGNDGSIGPIATGGSVSGNVIVQRMIKAKGIGNRYISFAVTGITFTDLTDDFNVQAGYVRFYNESVKGTIDKGYTNVSSGNLPFQTGRGYLAYMDANNDVLWDVTGPINSGNVPFPVTYTSTPNATADGWNLVGNPYPSPIIWNNNAAGWSRTNVDPVITVYDINGTASYTYNYTNGSGTLPNGMVATGQSFWVHLSAPGSMTVKEPAKISGAGGKFFRKSQAEPSQLVVSLSDGTFTDHSVLVIDGAATPGYDSQLDGVKFKDERFSIYFPTKDGRELVMNARAELAEDTVIPLEMQFSQPGEYRISFSGYGNFPYADRLLLVDAVTGAATPVSGQPYRVTVNSSALSIKDRFYLSFDEHHVAGAGLSVGPVLYPNPARDYVTIDTGNAQILGVELLNSAGSTIFSGVPAEGVLDVRELVNGLYLVRIRTSEGVFVKKILKKN